jgi:ornithine carbamoyltransferase
MNETSTATILLRQEWSKSCPGRRSLLSLGSLDSSEILKMVDRGLAFAKRRVALPRVLDGKVIGLYFRQTSTRTRTSFAVAVARLGGLPLTYGSADLQTETGESLEDTARVLSGYLDGLVIRGCKGVQELETFAAYSERMPVINAMSDSEHPTQAIADAITIKQHFGRLDIHLLYIGEGNNSAAALALLASRIPNARFTCVTPPGYGLPEPVMQRASESAREHGSVVEQLHSMDSVPRNVNVVYATRWITTGTSKASAGWKEAFRPFTVTEKLMQQVSGSEDTTFMHDLPAVRGEEVEAAVIDGPSSIAFTQAQNKLFAAMAVLEWCMGVEDDINE